METPHSTREIHLASRPHGEPTADDFELAEVDVPALDEGEVLVANHYMSVDPYMRGRMNDTKSYVPPFRIGAPLEGGAVGEVLASTSDRVPVGSTVLHGLGWREHAVLSADKVKVVDASLAPESAYLGALGMTGLTAWGGLTRAAAFQPGDAVFVSGAAGAVGSIVGQIAKVSGASRVVGSAGSPEKVARLLELGFDAAFDYHDGPVAQSLKDAAPDGIDVYFDNVGGEHLEAALSAMNVFGRVAVCGAISQYNATAPTPAPRNLALLIGKQLTLRGFLVKEYADLSAEFAELMAGWLADGSITFDETVREGLDQAPQALIDLLRGGNTGKMLVRL
ncbi:NADP-dependent oxidoreductase [Nocardioides euryhalodurans]|uniref:NADP-dependent oxidoreductase n=1 Tax=Nocardioides euryhalodurans TaxID=2518370 RepID=UPI003CC68A2D